MRIEFHQSVYSTTVFSKYVDRVHIALRVYLPDAVKRPVKTKRLNVMQTKLESLEQTSP